MDVELVTAAAGAVAGALGGGFWGRRSKPERDASSAKDLALAYGQLVDDLRKGQEDLRKHVHRQDGQLLRKDDEIQALRDEVKSLRDGRDGEMASLRQELATVRDELRLERLDNRQLRDRIAALEASRRSTDATAA